MDKLDKELFQTAVLSCSLQEIDLKTLERSISFDLGK